MLVNIRVPIDPPPTHQSALRVLKRKGGGMFIGKMKSSPAVKWKTAFELLLQATKPKVPMDGILRASVNFGYPLLKKHKNLPVIEAKITRPDCDNLVKSVLDCLVNVGYIVDDSNIAHLSVSKYYHFSAPYIDVIITEEKNNPFLTDKERETLDKQSKNDKQ
jgi:Holliday junction resolvase RusA-like endonuclease